jgi:hypothetical protein
MEGANGLPAGVIVVTNTNESGPGSLRDALAIANDGDTIDATGVSGTILLTSGELQITRTVTINGPGAGNLVVNGNLTFRVFENFAPNVTISGLTITNGLPVDGNGGGGILNHGGIILSNSRIVGNRAGNEWGDIGGGISNGPRATLIVTGSTINDNVATGGGGGISGINGATVTVTASTIDGNWGLCQGGGIHLSNGQLTVINSTVSGNSSGGIGGICEQGRGGGIWLYGVGTLTVTNSTISGNEVTGDGGGILLGGGAATVTNSTISDNSAREGGGIVLLNSATTTILDTVLKAGELGGTIFNNGGTVISLGYNLASDDAGAVLTGPGDQINTDPVLGPLQNNGGPTFTHALLPASPAIDAGDPKFTPPPYYDQRGSDFWRVRNSRIDKGSFEAQTGTTPTPTPTVTPTSTPTPAPTVRPSPTPRLRPTVHPRPGP